MGERSRVVPFSAVFNFRDLGGYTGLDGRAVRWGRLFRSDSLSRLRPDDRAAFTALGIRTVLDLRRPSEVDSDGRVPHWDGLAYRHIHPEHPEWDMAWYDPAAGVARFLADRYLELAETGAAGLAEALGVLAAEENAPIVVHCVAGKDRTGVVSALTLALLGVADHDIAADYALTDGAVARYLVALRATNPAATRRAQSPYAASPQEAMLIFLTELRQRHGSVERYLAAGGLDTAMVSALRAHLLTP